MANSALENAITLVTALVDVSTFTGEDDTLLFLTDY